ncbi:ABC transporter permease [Streptomyces sp. H10-C2]|uniref:ABC transporter permease n=1 Tax=unclassified Streptomyces TaxID=2593676 RepID=UPI0024BAD1AF|nr:MULTISPECIES: ABC transporter permease [unclassified Streptomyces]MDJ0346928.1 ABC transporter permease [Streptomyces sp. PH10-H1]MDJ0374328.1 ABC transporter permease [Streptomyces sp. H10-C2]
MIAAFNDSLALVGRQMRHIVRMPETLLSITLVPVAMVGVFGYMLGSAMTVPGGNFREFIMTGIFIQVMLTGMTNTAGGVSQDLSNGLVDRFRSLPIARSAVLVSRVVSDLALNTFSCAVMASLGLVMGWRAREGLLPALAGFGMLLLLGSVMSWLGALIAMKLRSIESVNAVTWVISMPLAFLSNAFVPLDGLPSWLRTVAEWNPISTVAQACRELFGNPGATATSDAFPAQHPVFTAVLTLVLLHILLMNLSVRAYRTAVLR